MSIIHKLVYFIIIISKSYESYQKSLESFIELFPYKFETFEGKGEFFLDI